MDYNFSELEPRWQNWWREHGVYHVDNAGDASRPNGGNASPKPHYYVLDMFPYPSGAGLHVGHPLGYIASDIYARYKRLRGYNVLHPMGYDAYGLPAEQYAIQTGQHPAVTTEKNIARYREQLDKIGFSFDWDREVRTCDPKYYKWTQWTFLQLFKHYYDNTAAKALPIAQLEAHFAKQGTEGLDAACTEEMHFTAAEWNGWDAVKRSQVLMNYRLAYLADTYVNWCADLGTVLANDEVVGGLSVRGGYPVERKLMRQWSLRISAYAQRLVDGLEQVDWTDSLKEIQRNWIGRSEGAAVWFPLSDKSDISFEIFTTRPDTIFGVTFMVLCPEHELIEQITTPEKRDEVMQYVTWAKNRSERERQAEVKKVSGVFTGAFAVNPLTEEKIPIYVSDYVLAGYGTGAIMAVPAHDSRDFAFARHFNLPIRQVVSLEKGVTSDPATWSESLDAKTGYSVNSGFVSGMKVKEAMAAVIDKIEEMGIGHRTVNYRLRDAIFSRQRYWGEPFPIYYKGGVPCPLPEECLPLELPEVDDFKPTATGEPPLGHAKKWAWDEKNRCVVEKEKIDDVTVFPLELSTMPGFAGSSGYYLRYMDPGNDKEYFGKDAVGYWQNVDLYVGGAEHGTGHLIYARFWNKFLYDIGLAVKEEPFQKLINQGMIQGRSNFVYRSKADNNLFVSKGLVKSMDDVTPIHVDINIVDNDVLDVEKFRQWRPEFADARFELEDGGEDEQEHVQCAEPRRPGGALRCRHAASVRDVPRTCGAGQAVGYQRHRGCAPLPQEVLAPLRRAERRICCQGGAQGAAPDDQENHRRRGAILVQHVCVDIHDMRQHAYRHEVRQARGVGASGGADGTLCPAYRRGTVAPTRPRGVGVRCAVACVRRPLPCRRHCEISRAVQRQDALHGGPAGHLYAGRGHCRHQGHARGAEVDGRQGAAQGDICSQEDYQYRTINVKQTFLKKQSASGDIRQPDGGQGCHTGMQGF